MTPDFVVLTTPRFDRLYHKLFKKHAELRNAYEQAVSILRTDPYNRSRAHIIRKLVGMQQGDGRYRLRLGRWRFRYDVFGGDVVLSYCGQRREETYR